MDNQKDMDKPENLSVITNGRQVRTNPFGENRAAERAYRRAERLAAALVLVTNHIDADEPLRQLVRTESAGLIAGILSLRDEMRSSRSAKALGVYGSIRYLVSLVRLLGASGHISAQNANVLIEALDELGNFIHSSQRSLLSENVTLSREELMDVGPIHTQNIKDKSVSFRKDNSGIKDMRKLSDKNGDRKKTADVRVRNILDIVRSGGEVGIKEIAAQLPEYSEKMIQRELLGLVARGQLKKTGLKRWSRYSIVP